MNQWLSPSQDCEGSKHNHTILPTAAELCSTESRGVIGGGLVHQRGGAKTCH